MAEYETIADLGNGLIVARTSIENLWEQDLNARVMGREMFNQLELNIKRRRGGPALESLPFCALINDKIEIVSGHHRVRAARAASKEYPDLKNIPILLDVSGLTRSEIASKQLSHNSIQGNDDPQVLARIYALIDDADLKLSAFIDERTLDLSKFDNIPVTPIETGIRMERVIAFFLPFQLNYSDKVLDFQKVIEAIEPTDSRVWLAPLELWEPFRKTIQGVMASEKIRSIGTALAFMIELTNQKIEEEANDSSS